jgi:hypothetical protein
VQVFEAVDGQVEIRYRDQRMRSHEIAAADVHARRTVTPRVHQPPAMAPTPKRLRPAADHPWRQMMRRAAQAGLVKKALRNSRCATKAPWDISNE